MKKGIALVLALVGLGAAYYGYQLYEDANAGISVLGIDISASDKEVTQQAYLYFAGAAVALVLALVVLVRK
ncbi:MAG: hypothetical protein AAFZ63_09500 [Bacteroidota bacterium]